MAMTPAQEWGRALKPLLKKKGMTAGRLALEVDVSRESVYQWTAGRWFPEYETARRVAYALGSDALLNLLVRLRTRECEHCGKSFVAIGKGTPGRWCSNRCRNHRWLVRRNKARGEDVKERNGRELALYRDAVEKMCWACEPEGMCRQPECELRNVSPLKLERQGRRAA